MTDLAEPEIELAEVKAGESPAPRARHGRVSLEAFGVVLQAIDFLITVVAGQLAYIGYNLFVLGERPTYLKFETPSLIGAFVLVFIARRFGIYTARQIVDLRVQCRNILYAWFVTLAVLALTVFAAKVAGAYSRGWAFLWAGLSVDILLVSRIGVSHLIDRWRASGRLFQRVALVGSGNIALHFVEQLAATRDPDVVLAGVYDDRFTRRPRQLLGHSIVGTTDDLVAHVRQAALDQIVIALPLASTARLNELIAKFRPLPIDLRIAIDQRAAQFPMQKIGATGPNKTIEVFDRPLKHHSGLIKWIEDYVLGILFLIIAAPLMALIALAIVIDSRGPALFVQERFGFNNKVFRVYKFRTMRIDSQDSTGAKRTERGDPRVTRVGRFLRHMSLDELPQLFNVLRGEMSLVGPRPHVVAMRAGNRLYHEALGDYFLRHRVKPGMTGWAQIHGWRGEIETEFQAAQRVFYDLDYIDKWTLWLDLKILLLTVWVVLLAKNAY